MINDIINIANISKNISWYNIYKRHVFIKVNRCNIAYIKKIKISFSFEYYQLFY